MINKLQKINPATLSANGTEITQQGQKIYNVGHADNISTGDITTNNIIISSGQSQCPSITKQCGTNRDYYNLFVMGGETFTPFSQGLFIVPKDRALTECVSPDIKDTIDSLTPDAIELIKTFPALFCSENTVYGKSDDSQQAYFGWVTGVKIQDNGIKIYYQTLNELSQKRLNEIIFELGISGNEKFNEFSRTHWCIKRINLIEELLSAGLPVLTY